MQFTNAIPDHAVFLQSSSSFSLFNNYFSIWASIFFLISWQRLQNFPVVVEVIDTIFLDNQLIIFTLDNYVAKYLLLAYS